MPLTLALREGDAFNVGPHRFKIEKILSETQCRLQIPGGEIVDIDDQHATKVAEGVRVVVGTRSQRKSVRVAIEADRSMRIVREHGRPGARAAE